MPSRRCLARRCPAGTRPPHSTSNSNRRAVVVDVEYPITARTFCLPEPEPVEKPMADPVIIIISDATVALGAIPAGYPTTPIDPATLTDHKCQVTRAEITATVGVDHH